MSPSQNKHYVEEETTTTKYMIYVDFFIDGVVEKPDVVGALFGQTEGLLSDHLDLRELQKSGRVGRIQVSLSIRRGKTKGEIRIPSSLDKVETSLLTAAIETVDRIGPCNANIKFNRIEDVREEKRKQIIERATSLLKKWDTEVAAQSNGLADEVLKGARVSNISNYGNLPAGSELASSDTIIVVEGRADILACSRAGVRNTIAVEGANVPRKVSDLTKRKTTIAFLDGDRGGDLILKELLMYADVDFVARAPDGIEVEDLKPEQIVEQLKKKVPIDKMHFISDIHARGALQRAVQRSKQKTTRLKSSAKPVARTPRPQTSTQRPSPSKTHKQPQGQKTSSSTKRQPSSSSRRESNQRSSSYRDRRSSSSRKRPSSSRQRSRRPQRFKPQVPEELKEIVKEVDGKEQQEGILLDQSLKEIKRVPVADIFAEIKSSKKTISKVVFDGIITQRLVDVCEEKNVEAVVGAKIERLKKKPKKTKIYSFA